MLHSHLPYYRKAGMWPFGEENFYECMAETYVPLLNIIADLWSEGIPAKITLGITPILAEQMADAHLNRGFESYLRSKIEASLKDEQRFGQRGEMPNPEFLHLAKFNTEWFQKIYHDYKERWAGNIINGFKYYQDLGAIEITTSAATHCFSPLLKIDNSINSQYKIGVDSYKKYFGKSPKGFWLPECAYRPAQGGRPGVEKWLHENGLKYFFTESAVIKGGQTAETRRVFGAYGTTEYIPAQSRPATGLDTYEAYWLKEYPIAVMGRNEEASYQVWSADHGYPGDGNYREFHKKDDVSGLHYWRLTSKTTDLGRKEVYSPQVAIERVHENSDHYVGLIQQSLTDYLKTTGKTGLILASFDTELFGHWWFEGILWIKEVIKKLHTYTAVKIQTASEYLDASAPVKAIELPESSWGAGGHFQVWMNDDTKWMWPIIHEAEADMQQIVSEFGLQSNDELIDRALKQAGRELLLLQSSDWPFLVTTGQAKDYATERFNEHNDRFLEIVKMIREGNIDKVRLAEIEDIDNCFADINVSSYLADEKANLLNSKL